MSSNSSEKTNSSVVDIRLSATTIFKMDIGFNDVNYIPKKCTIRSSPDKKENPILKQISGEFKSGRLTAIMGPSGAGKTTLLNVLSGFKTTGLTGHITINREPINWPVFRKNSAFITQDIALLDYLTANETLHFAAQLKLPSSISKQAKSDIVSEIVRLLGLQKCSRNYVYHLSGGEKKRLAIAAELITNPSVMFFDEPTSGLDSVSSAQVIKHLRELAHDGRTIISVIHQPSSSLFQLFDDLYVLSNGNCIYNGPLESMVETFKQAGFNCPGYYNRADYALEVAAQQHSSGNIDQLIAASRRIDALVPATPSTPLDNEKQALLPGTATPSEISSADSRNGPPHDSSYPISIWRQIFILTHRSMLCVMRDFYFAQLRVMAHIIVGLLLGSVFYNVGNDASKIMTNLSCLFFFLLFIFFANTMPTVLTFPSETTVFFNQCFLNHWYSLRAYYVSKLIADLPLQLICPLVFVSIAYFLTGQPCECDRWLLLLGMCILMAVMAHSLGLVAGAAFSIKHGVFLLPASSIPMLIFSGFFIRFDELPAYFKPLTYVSYFRYGLEGSVRAIYGNNRTNLDCDELFCYYKNVDKFLQHMDMTHDTYLMDTLGLVAWIVLLQAALFMALKIKIYQQR